MNHAVEAIMVDIDLATGPDRMSKEEALEILELCVDELRSRMEALRDELRSS